MRAWPLHIVFATMLVGSVAAKERAADTVADVDISDLETAVTRVAESHGLAFRENVRLGGNVPALLFEAAGCSRPVLVILHVTFDYEPLFRSAHEQGDDLRYIYIGRAWEKPARLAFFVERMRYAALATFGLTRYVPSGHLIIVDSPSACRDVVDAIEWRDVWSRDYLEAARAGALR
jgi:hypothetical protein